MPEYTKNLRFRLTDIMKNKSLLYFSNPVEFINYINQIEIYKEWKIESGYMNDRGSKITESKYFRDMRWLFDEKNIFRKKVSIAELTTWLDTFIHLERILTLLIANYPNKILSKIEISFEYVIDMSKQSRVDTIIKFNNNYILFEFSTVSNFTKMKSAFDKKRLELLLYKDMMANYIDYPSKLVLFPFIGLYEFNNSVLEDKHYQNNKKQAAYAYEYIKKYVLKNNPIQN